MCRQCGALVGAGESHCTMCGAPSTASARDEASSNVVAARPTHRHDHETMRFVRGIVSRPATFTFVFIVANIFIYLLMEFSGGATGDVLRAFGAKLNYLIDQEGQWWRFVTPIFLHVQMPGFGPLHLLVNMYGLFMLGPYVEKLYGSAKFVVFWIVTGVAGVVASYLAVQPELATSSVGRFLFKAYDAPSAGASGALFGLVGVLFVFGIKYRHELPEGFKRAFGTGMLPMIAINLFIGYVGRGFIDNAAHMGGLAAGMLLALIVGYKRPGERGPVAYVWHVLQAGLLALVVACFVMVAIHFETPKPPLETFSAQALTGETAGLDEYIESINAGQLALVEAMRNGGGELAAAIERLEKTPRVNERADALREELKELLVRARDLNGDRQLARRERTRRGEQLFKDFNAWNERRNQWIEAEGKNLGLVLEDRTPPADAAPQEAATPPEGK
jgi:membrane associated rhomboid family serine protease